jgi:hypothetical protein
MFKLSPLEVKKFLTDAEFTYTFTNFQLQI